LTCSLDLDPSFAISDQQFGHIQRELAEHTINALTRPYWLYHLHAALGENDLAFAALEQALVERQFFLAWLPVGRSLIGLTRLESDPRWQAFIEKVKAAMQAGASATV
jgi:hypothetical protein